MGTEGYGGVLLLTDIMHTGVRSDSYIVHVFWIGGERGIGVGATIINKGSRTCNRGRGKES